MKTRTLAALALVGMLAAPMVSSAAIISGTFNFSATGFIPAGAPVNPFTGSFSITFDNSADIADTTAGFALLSSNAPLITGSSAFRYRAFDDLLLVGGTNSSVGLINTDALDWGLAVASISTSPTFDVLRYSTGGRTLFSSVTGEVSSASVPEPGTLALLGLGLAGLGMARRKRAA